MSFDLLTGATGFLGSYLLRDALSRGHDVAVLVRPVRGGSAEQRVQSIVDGFHARDGHARALPKVIQGDLHQPDLGLDAASRSWIAENCRRVVHCAASLTFNAKAGEPYRTNVDGTRYVLRLCQEAGIRDFHLISTAYVCGTREGLVFEDELECGQEFSNDYERSKFLSETLVRQAPFLDRWTVYRPSVIVGDSRTGFTSSDDGLYAFYRLAALFEGKSGSEIFAWLGLHPDDRLNLVPVDWVSAAVTHLLDSPQGSGTTYHLTHSHPVAARDIPVPSVRSNGASTVPPHALDNLLKIYGPYMKHHCSFDRSHLEADASHLPCEPLEGSALERMVHFAEKELLGSARGETGRSDLALVVGATGSPALDLTLPTSPAPVALEEAEEARVRAYCTADTLTRLTGGEVTVEQAVFSGMLALEGDVELLDLAQSLLDEYVADRQGTTPVVAGGNG